MVQLSSPHARVIVWRFPHFPQQQLLLLFAAILVTLSEASYRTEEDSRASQLAVKRANEDCSAAPLGSVDRVGLRRQLEAGVGSDNLILEALQNSNGTDELANHIEKEVTWQWALSVAGPLVFSLVLFALWLFCCWTAFPCCRCCRCCQKPPRKAGLCGKLFFALMIAGLIVGMLVCSFMAYGGRAQVNHGLNSVACTSGKVLNYTLNGNIPNDFVGMLPLLDQLSQLRSVLDDGSNFLDEVYVMLGDTKEIERATYLATQTTDLLGSTLSLPANVNPEPLVAEERTLHRCELCERINSPLSQVSDALANGLATALADARGQVDEQLGGGSRRELQSFIDTAVTPVRDAANTIRDSTGFFLKDDFAEIKNSVIMSGGVGVISISVIAFLVGACSGVSVLCCVVEEYNEEMEDVGNPWTKAVPRCALCSWCCGWLYAFLVFFFGGLMLVLVVPMSSLCLVMEDLDSQLLKTTLPGLGVKMDTKTPEFGMIADMLDTCFSLQSPPTNRSLMDLVFMEENGVRLSLAQKLKMQTVDLIDAQFAALASNEQPPKIVQDVSLNELLDLLKSTPVDGTILAQADLVQKEPYAGLISDSRPPSVGVQVGLGSSLACSDVDFGGATVPGINKLKIALENFTSAAMEPTVPPLTCGRKVVCNRDPDDGSVLDCTTSPTLPPCKACAAGNALMELKAQLDAATFRCDIFEDAGGRDCDPRDMAKVATVWQDDSDCVQATNQGFSITRKEKTCTLQQFVTYVRDWHQRLQKVFTRVDEAIPKVQSTIATRLQNLVRATFVTPVNRIIDLSQCRFLKLEYGDLVDGLCYRGVIGFRTIVMAYIWNGALTVILVLVTYIMWRRAYDNVEGFAKNLKKTAPA